MIGYTTKEGILFDIVRKSTPNVKLPKSMDTEVPFDLDVVDNEKKHIEIKSRIKKTYFKDEMIKENNIDYLYTVSISLIILSQKQTSIKHFFLLFTTI